MNEHKRRLAARAALAGLLHDIGKFGQRAGEVARDGRSHPAVGDKFVSQYVPPQWQPICAPVGWHHSRLSDNLTKIVALADRLSAGERESYSEEEKNLDRVKQLLSIFPRLAPHETSPAPSVQDLYIPLRALELEEEALFPKESPSQAASVEYRRLWDAFCEAMAGLQRAFRDEEDLESYLMSLSYLLQKYTWCMPSAFYHDRPDVSLYDHLRTTAALAAALAWHWDATEGGVQVIDHLLGAIRGREPVDWPEEPEVAGLLSGDLSGIQQFLFGFHHARGAAATLRARSLYIQLLTEAAARAILRDLALPPTNALYVGGGTFALVVPVGARDVLETLARDINAALLEAHRGQLYLALAFAPLVPRDFGIGKTDQGSASPLAQRWSAMQGMLEARKLRRFAELPVEALQQLFAPQGQGFPEGKVCGVCGTEAPDPMVDEEGTPWCRSCDSFRELGRSLRTAQYIAWAELPKRKSPPLATWEDVLGALGFAVQVGEHVPQTPAGAVRAQLLALSPDNVPPAGARTAVGWRPLVSTVPLAREGEAIPTGVDEGTPRPGEIKHFGVLARQSDGAPYLGVLRMDMDNLGRIFSRGLGGRDTLSRRATVSFLLSLFFEGWVGEIARRVGETDGRERLYSVYSGGDDLFFVGSWDAVVDLARRVRADLRRYTGRDDFGISGGIALVHEKFPLYLAAERAKDAEDQAKALRKGKDAVAFLGLAVPWERFGFDGGDATVTGWAERFRSLLQEEGAPRALVQRVQDFYLMYIQGRSARGPWGPWVWRCAYTLTRAADRAQGETAEEIRRLAELLAGGRFAENIDWLALAARWADLATRRGGDDAELI